MYFYIKKINSTADQFINYWSSNYYYPKKYLYMDCISKTSYTTDDLNNLFIWKNAMRLSDRKKLSFERKICRKLELVNRLKSNFSLEEYNNTFIDLSSIWKIFLLHCIKPKIYPIFDQHVFRAMMYIQYETIEEVSKSDKKKYSQYFELYLPFFNNLVVRSGCERIEVDHALWAFGKSL